MTKPTETPVDVKPRSRDVTDGNQKAAARAMLRAVGLTDATGRSHKLVSPRRGTKSRHATHHCAVLLTARKRVCAKTVE